MSKLLFSDAKAALSSAWGLCASDTRLDDRVNEAVRRLMLSGNWVGTVVQMKVLATSRFLTMPREVEAIYEATVLVDTETDGPANGWYSVQSYSGYLDPDGMSDSVFLDRGEFPTVYDFQGASKIRVYSDVPLAGVATWAGTDSVGNPVISETISLASGTYTDSATSSTKVINFVKPRTGGMVRVYAVADSDATQTLLAILYPDETVACYRRYYIPDLPELGAMVRITAKLRWTRAYQDYDVLGIRNIDAIKLMGLAILQEEAGRFDIAGQFSNEAINLLTKERDQYLIDPTNIAERKASYKNDVDVFDPGTLGFIRGRLGYELPGGAKMGKLKLTRVLEQALEKIVDRYNFLVTQQRLGIHTSVTTLTLDPLTNPEDPLPYSDYDDIKQMVQSILLVDSAKGDSELQAGKAIEEAVYKNIEVALQTTLETLRHTTYTDTLNAALVNSFAYFQARLALDLPNGLSMSETEIARLLNEAEERLLNMGKWKGSIAYYEIAISADGVVTMPASVGTILAADINFAPVVLRDEWFDFHIDGPGWLQQSDGTSSPSNQPWGSMLIDRGETVVNGNTVRQYYVHGGGDQPYTLRVKAKTRFVKKSGTDLMVIRNFPALKRLVQSVIAPDPALARAAEEDARKILNQELKEYRGIPVVSLRVQTNGFAPGEVTSLW